MLDRTIEVCEYCDHPVPEYEMEDLISHTDGWDSPCNMRMCLACKEDYQNEADMKTMQHKG